MAKLNKPRTASATLKGFAATALALVAFGTATHAGGPWTHQKGKGYLKLSEYWIVFDSHFTDVGKIDPNVTTGIFNTNAYFEYGIATRFTGVVNATLLSRNYMNNLVSRGTGEVLVPGEAYNSLGDIDLSLKYGLNKPGAKFPIAASVMFGLPTGNPSAGTEGNLQTGDGEFNQMIQLDAGTGFNWGKKVSGYFSTYVGFNNRTNDFSEEIRYGLESGAGLANNKLWVIGRITGIESLKNGPASGTITSTSIFANNAEYTSMGLEVAYSVTKNLGFSASAAGAFRAEIIAAAPSYSVGVFWDFSR